jgi:hypothetical protein
MRIGILHHRVNGSCRATGVIEAIRSLITRQQRDSSIPRGLGCRFPRRTLWVLQIALLMGRLTHVGSKQGAFHQEVTCIKREMTSLGSTVYRHDGVIQYGTCCTNPALRGT